MTRCTHRSRIHIRTAIDGTRSGWPVLLLVVHTWPAAQSSDGEPVGRIISARKATARERKIYEEGTF